jgi:hypothetical protein
MGNNGHPVNCTENDNIRAFMFLSYLDVSFVAAFLGRKWPELPAEPNKSAISEGGSP